MQIFLASYFEEEYHGPGRRIGVSPGKPNNLDYDCDFMFKHLSPGDLYWDYHKNKNNDYETASKTFTSEYRKQLDEFKKEVINAANQEEKDPQSILPFEDGDTLLTWEKRGNVSYRTAIAQCLLDLGYDVEEY